MRTQIRPGPFDFNDFLELVREDQKADLLDGNILMASPESTPHNKLVGFLYHLIDLYVVHRALGYVSVNKVAYRLSDKNAPEPDIGFVAADRVGLVQRGYVDGPPDLAIEVVSPDSVERDYESKRLRYESARVREYWVIDPDERRATFFRMGASEFEEVFPAGGEFSSTVLRGFVLEVAWLWQDPLPDPLPIVSKLRSQKP